MIELPILDPSKRRDRSNSARRFWRSLGELNNDESLAKLAREEFLPEAAAAPDGSSRRQFLQLMGASMALAGLTGCRKPYEKILPYARKPEDVIPGIAQRYATAMPFRGSLSALLVQSHEGRPTKVEGNPEHPVSRGASGVFEQASILNLYDPDRSQHVRLDGGVASWEAAVSAMRDLPASTRLAVLVEESGSPTVAALRERVAARFPSLTWVAYDSFGGSREEAGYATTFGADVRPRYRFSNARVVVSLDADFLATTDRNFVHNTRELAAGRSISEGNPLRLYAFESGYSTTGGMADHRARVRPVHVASVAAAIAARLGVPGSRATEGRLDERAGRLVDAAVSDLRAVGPRAVVVAGDSQPAEVHAYCAAINAALGSIGTTVELLDIAGIATATPAVLASFVAGVKAGAFDAILAIGSNPVYDLAGDDDFVEAWSTTQTTFHVGLHVDETAAISTWHIPEAHYLEAWGDGRAFDGTLSVVQPLIAPLYPECKSEIEVLDALAGGQTAGYDLVREQWRAIITGPFERGWRRVVHDGYLPGSTYGTVSPEANVQLPGLAATAASEPGGFDVQVVTDTRVFDGSFANNAWLQETPELTTKIVWDNVAIMSRATAETIGVSVSLKAGKYYVDRVTLALGGRTVTLPAWVAPGIADDTIVVWAGFGRSLQSDRERRQKLFFDVSADTDIYGDGPLANGVGQNIRRLQDNPFALIVTGVSATLEPDRYHVVTTQDHGALDSPDLRAEIESREPVRTATITEYENHEAHFTHPPLAGAEEPWTDYPALWESRHPSREAFMRASPYADNQWGMVIDLNTCTGCNACVVACQAENNIQVVGKREVGRGREMSWLRVDRYFVSEGRDVDEARLVVQPLPCQHCENAPCESVCPVAATVHSPDGTNQMIYNRCIGTRYCANNCPYKVRRFNFFNWVNTLPTSVHMAQNPNVTVRTRGVMEKCSYCIHRIRAVNQQANVEDRAIRDGEVLTACQQACPANAISFGDLNDPTSEVSQWKKSDRRYELLAELSVKPRTSYLGRISNPNPDLEAQA